MHQRPTFNINQTVFMPKLNNPEQYITCKVLGVPPPESNLYTIQRYDNHNIIQLPEHKIKASNPNATPHNIIQHINNSLPQWFTINSPATIYTPDMKKPKRGTLQQHQDNRWYFHTGRKNRIAPIPLPTTHTEILHLITTHQLTRGHPPFHKILNQHRQQQFQASVAVLICL